MDENNPYLFEVGISYYDPTARGTLSETLLITGESSDLIRALRKTKKYIKSEKKDRFPKGAAIRSITWRGFIDA